MGGVIPNVYFPQIDYGRIAIVRREHFSAALEPDL